MIPVHYTAIFPWPQWALGTRRCIRGTCSPAINFRRSHNSSGFLRLLCLIDVYRVYPTNSCAWGIVTRGNIISLHNAAARDFPKRYLPSNLSGRMPIRGKPVLPLIRWPPISAPLPINYFVCLWYTPIHAAVPDPHLSTLKPCRFSLRSLSLMLPVRNHPQYMSDSDLT